MTLVQEHHYLGAPRVECRNPQVPQDSFNTRKLLLRPSTFRLTRPGPAFQPPPFGFTWQALPKPPPATPTTSPPACRRTSPLIMWCFPPSAPSLRHSTSNSGGRHCPCLPTAAESTASSPATSKLVSVAEAARYSKWLCLFETRWVGLLTPPSERESGLVGFRRACPVALWSPDSDSCQLRQGNRSYRPSPFVPSFARSLPIDQREPPRSNGGRCTPRQDTNPSLHL